MADVLTPEQRSKCMSKNKGKDTKPEIILRKALWAKGIRYRKNYKLPDKLPGKPDIVFVGKKIAVFVDGCFWHQCPLHFQMPDNNRVFWEKKINRNVERDKEVTSKLEDKGWKVVRFWEHEIKDDLESLVKKIKSY